MFIVSNPDANCRVRPTGLARSKETRSRRDFENYNGIVIGRAGIREVRPHRASCSSLPATSPPDRFFAATCKDDRRKRLPNISITRAFATRVLHLHPFRYVSLILRRPTANFAIDFRRRYHVTRRKDAAVSDSMTSRFW